MSQQKRYAVWERALMVWMAGTCCLQPALGGTQGSFMNSAGFGVAVDSVVNTYNDPIFGPTTTSVKVTSNKGVSMFNPCAAVNPQNFDCDYKAGLPPYTSRSVYCQSVGFPNYQWVVKAYVTGGATADNPKLEQLLNVVPQDCAEISVQTEYKATRSQITVTGFATAGAALGLRGYEVPENFTPHSDTDLEQNGELKFEILLPGPFSFNVQDCTVLNIPVHNPHPERFYFKVDTVALSNPFVVSCPEPGEVQLFECGQPVVYPLPLVSGGCGQVTVTYNPPPEQLPPGETLVTVTAADEVGNVAECSFWAVRGLTTFAGFESPIRGTGGTCDKPLRTLNRGSNLPIKFSIGCEGVPYAGQTRPYVRIYQCEDLSLPVEQGDFQEVASVWHFNWDTSNVSPGVYVIRAYLPDGIMKEAVVRLR